MSGVGDVPDVESWLLPSGCSVKPGTLRLVQDTVQNIQYIQYKQYIQYVQYKT